MGILPSAALKWNAAKEEFMKGVDWVNEMAIRVSAGRTGNDAISTYRSLAALSSTTNGYLFGGSQPAAYYPSRLASPNLTWEKTDLYNLGIDLAFLNNRLFVTAEAYISKNQRLVADFTDADTNRLFFPPDQHWQDLKQGNRTNHREPKYRETEILMVDHLHHCSQ